MKVVAHPTLTLTNRITGLTNCINPWVAKISFSTQSLSTHYSVGRVNFNFTWNFWDGSVNPQAFSHALVYHSVGYSPGFPHSTSWNSITMCLLQQNQSKQSFTLFVVILIMSPRWIILSTTVRTWFMRCQDLIKWCYSQLCFLGPPVFQPWITGCWSIHLIIWRHRWSGCWVIVSPIWVDWSRILMMPVLTVVVKINSTRPLAFRDYLNVLLLTGCPTNCVSQNHSILWWGFSFQPDQFRLPYW